MAITERKKRIYRKRIPYGMQNFEDVIKDDCYYVDKTPFIEEIEDAHRYFFYIRPRRFGKTLTLSMLENYYDINKKDQFEQLFGKLYIGQNPTPERNAYLVIHLNFTEVVAGGDDYKKEFDAYCQKQFFLFVDTYASLLPQNIKEELEKQSDAASQLSYICAQSSQRGLKLYLFIDNYDSFINLKLANKDTDGMLKSQMHESFYHFFTAIKSVASGSLSRLFVVGEFSAPVKDSDGGFNIGTNYSLSPEFNEMTGFTEEEVREMLEYYSSVLPFRHSVDELIQVMKPWYDNYCFSMRCYGKTTMYNSVMVLNFIDKYIRNGYDMPDSMVESNVRMDYEKMRMLIRHDKEFAHDASIIQQLVTRGFKTGKLVENFPAESIDNPNNFLSLLFYFGMVTIGGTYEGETKFIIPNEVVRDQIYTYLLDTYGENDLTYDTYDKNSLENRLAYRGDYKAYFEFVADSLKRHSSQRDKQKGEAYVHGFTLAMTCQNQFYRPVSELDTDGGYADIFLSPLTGIYKDMKHSYIIELKYCKTSTTDDQLQRLFRDASEQVGRYADTDTVHTSVKGTTLHKLVVIFRGAEMAVCREV